jgi:hypothetical protein
MHSLPKDTGAVIFSLPRGAARMASAPVPPRSGQDLAALFHILLADFRQACRRVVRASSARPAALPGI